MTNSFLKKAQDTCTVLVQSVLSESLIEFINIIIPWIHALPQANKRGLFRKNSTHLVSIFLGMLAFLLKVPATMVESNINALCSSLEKGVKKAIENDPRIAKTGNLSCCEPCAIYSNESKQNTKAESNAAGNVKNPCSDNANMARTSPHNSVESVNLYSSNHLPKAQEQCAQGPGLTQKECFAGSNDPIPGFTHGFISNKSMRKSMDDFDVKPDDSAQKLNRRKSSVGTTKYGYNMISSQKMRFFERVADKSQQDIVDQEVRLMKAHLHNRSSSVPKNMWMISGRGRNPRPLHDFEIGSKSKL